MPQPNTEELSDIKYSILKNLERTLKIGYEHQYRNILSAIVSNRKRFVKKRLPADAAEDVYKYDSLAVGLTNYLINLFDVFGESAVLNAKNTFEGSGLKWGKKLRKKFFGQNNSRDIEYMIKYLYINVPEIDYMEMSDNNLVWHLKKLGNGSVNEGFGRFHLRFYDIKAAWLHSFIKSFSSQYTGIFEKKSEDENEIVTSIKLNEDNKNAT